ncbi:IS30 family transposase [Candidatus Poriferisodalis sp.]|uniref:IS30 family transposase n=1 Tax=Candidatus Poriferisodalis sp. TaxID=3101277 RepID=UPI003B52B81F
MRSTGATGEGIATALGRHPATVYRELGRCGGPTAVYDAAAAQTDAKRQARRPRACKLEADPVLAAQVKRPMKQRWSPQAISADVAAEGQRVCAETIYRAAYSGCGLGAQAWADLPRGRRRRRRRSRHSEKASPLGDYRPLSRRPAAVEERNEPGHWEGDLIIGAANRTAAATLVERVSRHTLVVALPHGYRAPQVAAAVTDALANQPAHLLRSLTWDQGREMARWADIETALGIEVFFCEPHSPSQRGTNEQTNGLLRRWLPKGTSLDLSPLRLSIIEDNLNWMPRRLHNWQSAAEAYTRLARNHR